MEDKKTPGQLLRAHRLRPGINQAVFTSFLNCTRNDLSLYENDKNRLSKTRRLHYSSIIPEFTPDMLTAEGQNLCTAMLAQTD